MKKLTVLLCLAVAVLALAGCDLTAHGGGQVDLLQVNGVSYEPGTATATFALTTNCNDHKDALMSHIVWNDQTNGVQFTARTPWTSVIQLSGGDATNCDELAALGEQQFPVEGSFGMGVIDAQGQEVGFAAIWVIKPGQDYPPLGGDVCGGTAATLIVQTDFDYIAIGCLDKGNVVFQ